MGQAGWRGSPRRRRARRPTARRRSRTPMWSRTSRTDSPRACARTITDDTVQSARNCPPSAASRSAAPAWRGSTCAIANTATGPIENQALVAWISSLLGRTPPRTTSGSFARRNATVTAIGTSASGIANSSGTKASCVGTVKPRGVSNGIVLDTVSTSRQISAGASANACGGAIDQATAGQDARATAEIMAGSASWRRIGWARRRNVSSSSACSVRLGSKDISHPYRPATARLDPSACRSTFVQGAPVLLSPAARRSDLKGRIS